MLRSRETVSTCALVLVSLVGCASLDEADARSADTAIAEHGHGDDGAAFALTTEGIIRGVATETTRAFRGIPYAAPPVGARRWRPPQRAARRNTILDATQFANRCPQIAGPFGQGSDTEDCLFLNVTATATASVCARSWCGFTAAR